MEVNKTEAKLHLAAEHSLLFEVWLLNGIILTISSVIQKH